MTEKTRLARKDADSATESEPINHTLVSLVTGALEVIEQPAPLPHELEQPAAGVVVLRVGLEVFRQVVDSLTQQRDLDFRRPGIGWMLAKLFHQLLLSLQSDSHHSSVLFNRVCYHGLLVM